MEKDERPKEWIGHYSGRRLWNRIRASAKARVDVDLNEFEDLEELFSRYYGMENLLKEQKEIAMKPEQNPDARIEEMTGTQVMEWIAEFSANHFGLNVRSIDELYDILRDYSCICTGHSRAYALYRDYHDVVVVAEQNPRFPHRQDYKCPICGGWAKYRGRHCPNCGAKLLWPWEHDPKSDEFREAASRIFDDDF